MIPAPAVVVRNIKSVVGDDRVNNNFKDQLEELKQRFKDLSDLL